MQRARSDKSILHFIQQAGSLLLMPRTHKRSLGNTFDTVASHSFHVAIIAYCIARMEKLDHNEALRALAMGVLHDLAEARTGDLDLPAKSYATTDDEKAVHDQFVHLVFGQDLEVLMQEYEKRETMTAKCAKDADAVGQMYLEWVLMWQGNRLAERWFEGDFKHRVPYFRTASAKKLAMSMKDSYPLEWWKQFMETGVNLKHLNSEK